ncbi:MAG: adenylate/guanylate cyclase domain-containing protein [Pseudomonadota bacterium]
MTTGSSADEMTNDVTAEALVPEGSADTRYAYARWTLEFLRPGIEAEYITYRTPVILRYLRWLLLVGAAMVFAGSIIDFSRLDSEDARLVTDIRIAAALGMLGAWALTGTRWVQENLQLFVGVGTVLIHMIWLATVPIVESRIDVYQGVLPINIMLTFLVSGLMFRWARWVALAATLAYMLALNAYLPAPEAPVLYLLLAGLYAGFAAYVAERARREAWAEARALDTERARSEKLLLNVLPPSIAGRMKDGEELIADRFDDSAVLFADICGFTAMSASMDPADLVEVLDEIFKRFDLIVAELDLEKIKTIGDCYMIACGLPRERACQAWRLAEAALRMQRELGKVADKRNLPLQVRIGMHCGPVVAGVIGHSKFIYDLWGDTVNLASRMESSAPEGAIQLSGEMQARLTDHFVIVERGELEMKGKGIQMAYLLTGRKEIHV